MTVLDTLLQRWRIRMALPHVPPDSDVLDIGCADGALFRQGGLRGVGVDPELVPGTTAPDHVTLLRGAFPDSLQGGPHGPFDVATALAVVEHVPPGGLEAWADALRELVRPGGSVIITVPSPVVDRILHVLMRLRLVDGMEAHQHHGFQPVDLLNVFGTPAWHLERHRRFQLGLNNLFVFRRTA